MTDLTIWLPRAVEAVADWQGQYGSTGQQSAVTDEQLSTAFAALTERLQGRLVGRVITLALVGLVVAAGVSLWVNGAFFGVRPSVNAMTH